MVAGLDADLIRGSTAWEIVRILRKRDGAFMDAQGSLEVRLPRDTLVSLFSFGATLTDQAEAEQFLANSSAALQKLDLTEYSQVRLIARVTTASASVNTPQVDFAFKAGAFSTTPGDYTEVAGVEASLAAVGLVASAWVDLPAAARADVFLAVLQRGGDGVADPAVGRVEVQFR